MPCKVISAGLPKAAFTACENGGSSLISGCLLYTSDAADERSSVDLGGRRIIKKKNNRGHQVGEEDMSENV